MHAYAEAGKALGPHRHAPPGVCCSLASHDNVIGKAEPDASALHTWPDLACQPFIQDLMEEDLRQHRGDDPALPDAGLRVTPCPCLHDAGP
jgi:hypothetical protein